MKVGAGRGGHRGESTETKDGDAVCRGRRGEGWNRD